jgi:hypothetical protein
MPASENLAMTIAVYCDAGLSLLFLPEQAKTIH